MVPPSRQCSEKPAKVTETAEHEKKKKLGSRSKATEGLSQLRAGGSF